MQQEDWQPIDAAPVNGTEVLVWRPPKHMMDDKPNAITGHYLNGQWLCSETREAIEPTHYQRIVPPKR